MKILIGGDISVVDSAELYQNLETEKLFNDVLDEFKKADEVIVNLECAVTDSTNEIKKFGPCLKAPVNTCKTLKKAGVTLCALSNNHIFDFGREGLSDTVKYLNESNLPYTGIGKNYQDSRKDYVIEREGKKIAIINVCEHEYSTALEDRVGARPYDPYETNDDIVKAKQSADYVIVIYHGGKEHSRYPSPRLIKLCRSMIKHGADVVLCQHSHCIGAYEEFMGGHILYGQGNFHFIKAEKTEEMWNTALLVDIEITDKLTFKMIPTVVDGLGIKKCDKALADKIFAEIDKRGEELKDGTWLEKWRETCATYGVYNFVPENIRDLLGHFIECEAHLDVL